MNHGCTPQISDSSFITSLVCVSAMMALRRAQGRQLRAIKPDSVTTAMV